MLSREKTKTDDSRQEVNKYPVKEQYVLSRLLPEYVSLYRIDLNSGKYEILRLDANTNARKLAEKDSHPAENFDEYADKFKKIMPVDYNHMLQSISQREEKGMSREQAEIEARIVQLEKMLRNAEVIDEEEGAKDTISLGTTVTVLDVEFDEEMEYTIVGSAEADPMNGRISNESPVGMALLGHKKDDIIMIETPDGEVEFKVLRFTK